VHSLVKFGLVLVVLLITPISFKGPSQDLSFRTLLARYDEFCLRAFPSPTSVAATIAAHELNRVDPYQLDPYSGSAIANTWTGDIASSGPEAGKELILQIGILPLQACAVTTNLASTPGDLSAFIDLVDRYLSKTHRNGRMVDDTAYVRKQIGRVGINIPLHLSLIGKPSEMFYLAVWPPTRGLVRVQIDHRLVAGPTQTL